MRKLLYLLLISFGIFTNTYAQKDIPAGIPKRAFSMQMTQYPKGTDLVWKALPDSTYTVTFKINGKPGFVHYAHNCAAMEVQAEIDSASLPRAIVRMIDTQYPGYKYQYVGHFMTSIPTVYDEDFLKYTHEHYRLVIVKGNDSYKLYLGPDATLLNTPELKSAK